MGEKSRKSEKERDVKHLVFKKNKREDPCGRKVESQSLANDRAINIERGPEITPCILQRITEESRNSPDDKHEEYAQSSI